MAVGGLGRIRAVASVTAFIVLVSVLSVVPPSEALAQTSVTVSTVTELQSAVSGAATGATILVSPGTYQLTTALVVAPPGVTIVGQGAKAGDTKLIAANNKRVFTVSATATSTAISNLAITGGIQNSGSGGGIRVEAGASLAVTDVEIVDNFASEGGGVSNAGTLTVRRSLFENNVSRKKGGAIDNLGTLTVVNSTFTDNQAQGGGGVATSGTATLSFVTIFANRSTNKIGAGTNRIGGTLSIKNSIVANNVGSDNEFHDCSGSPNLANAIVTSLQGCNPSGMVDVHGPTAVVAGLPAANNGGPTRTLALIANSPAINYTTDCNDLSGSTVTIDQRNVPRIDGTCDLGAYEVDQTAPDVSATASPAPNQAGWNNSPVSVTLTASEVDASIEYSTDSGTTWTGYITPLLVTEEGTTSLLFRATDADGNTTDPPGALEINLDATPPVVTPTTGSGTTEGDILLTLAATDDPGTGINFSGVAEIQYTTDPVDPGDPDAANWTTYTSEILISQTTTVFFRATDVAGNTASPDEITLSIEPLTFDLSMTTNLPEVEVGAVIVPVENISGAIQAAAGANSPTGSTPLASIPLASIPLASIPTSSTPLASIPLASIPLASIPLASISLTNTPLASIPLASIPLASIDTVIDCSQISCADATGMEFLLIGTPLQGTPLQALNFTDLVSVPLASIPLASIPLASIPLASIPLASIPLASINTVIDCDLIVGGCAAPNTLRDAYDAGAVLTGTVGDVLSFDDVGFGATPLASIPLASIAMGTTPLASIPLSADLTPPATDSDRLAAWCNALGYTSGTVGCQLVETNGTSLMTLALGGVPLASIPLASIPLASIPLASIPLASIPLASIFWASTPLASIPLASIPTSAPLASIPLASIPLASIGNLVDCNLVNCTTGTLGDAATNGAFLVQSLGELGPYLATATVADLDGLDGLDAYSLADLLYGLIAPTEVPWEKIDLNAARLPDAADPKQPAFTYDISLVVGGARNADITLVLDPPTGFYFARDLGITGPNYPTDPAVPTSLDGVQIDDPTEDLTTGNLTLNLSNVAPGTHTVSIAMRAGIVLGDHTASVTGDATTSQEGPVSAGPASSTIVVLEAGEGAATIPTLVDGELNLSHISRSDDVDLYEFTVTEATVGSSARILLSNLPADYDLVLYGPPVSAPLRGTPRPGFGLVEDFVFDLNPDDEVLDTDTLADVVHDPAAVGLTAEVLNSVSAKRGTNDESIDTGTLREGRYVVQVSSYNGAFNDNPFGLRLRLSESAKRPCDVPGFTLGARGTLPSVYPTGVNTLFLYNHARLVAEFPNDYQQVIDELARVATADWTELGVIGAVLPVDGDAAVWAALGAGDPTAGLAGDRCNPQASNNVVRAIGSLVDTVVAAHPTVENIVIVGDDAQIPMARIPDGTSISNEREHAQTFAGNNELVGALLGGYYLSDVPYGTAAGIAVNDHEFFVPERAVGRLVEHPDQIAQALDNFVVYDGRLDPSTAAAASGYDFLGDGTEEVKTALISEGFTVGSTPQTGYLNNETWDRQDLIDLLSTGPAVASINAHFDESRALPALGNSQNDESDLFTVSDIPAGLNRSLLFSMGCHAGLSLSDVQLGSARPDWAQSFSDLEQSLWAANTGYGYGDSKLVALSEELTAGFAGRLGSFPVGKAWQLAMQAYAADLFTLTPYDEKVLQEFTLYGLPMYVTGPATGQVPDAPPAEGAGPAIFVDPFTSLESAPVSLSLQLGGTAASGPGYLHLNETPDGDYYDVNGDTLEVRSRPVQPLARVDVTQPDGAGGLASLAGGALITGLTGLQETGFDPLVFTPVVDLSDATNNTLVDAFRPEAADATFPAGIQRITTYEDDSGQQRQSLLTVPGRFVANGPGGSNTQELFTEIESQVYYRDPASTDFTPPAFAESIGRFGDGVVHFEVDVTGGGSGADDVERVYVLFRPDGAVGLTKWQGVDLARVPGTDTWLGGRPVEPFTGTDYEFFVQAVDAHGNVAMSDSKGVNFLTSEPTESAFIVVSIDGDYSATTGWYRTASATATTQAVGATITSYRLDFGPDTPWSGDALPIVGDGGHLLQVFDSVGNQGLMFVAVDGTGPLAFGSFAPPPTPTGWNGGNVTVTLTAIDPFGSGVSSLVYSTDGTTPSIEYTGPFVIDQEGATTVRYLATDAVGNQGEEGEPLVIQVDLTAPDVTAVVPSTSSGWYNTPVDVTLEAVDPGSGVATIEYRLDPADPWILYSAPFEVSVEGSTTIYFRATDSVGNTGDGQFDVGTLDVQIDLTAPTVTITVPGEGSAYPLGSTPPLPDFACDDELGGSGIATCDTEDVIDTSTIGTKTFSVTGTDIAGNSTVASVTYSVTDAAPPTVSASVDPAPNAAGWNKTTVTVTISADDGGGSGVASVEYSVDGGDNWTLYTGPFAWSTEGTTTFSFRATDSAGNTSAPGTLSVSIDTVAPTVTSSQQGAFYVLDEVATISFSCADAGSGVATCTGTLANGAAVSTSTIGTKSFVVTGTDTAGNVTATTVTYTVGYRICLLYDPLKEMPATGTMVIKLELCRANGTRVTGPARTLIATLIDGAIVPSPNDTGSSNDGMEFRYDSKGKRYIYNLNVDQLTDANGNPVALPPGFHTMGFTIDGVAATSYVAGFTLK